MAPFGSVDRADSLETFLEGLPPLEQPKTSLASASQSLFEGLASLKQSRVLYRLAVIDEAGKPMGYPSEADLERLSLKPNEAFTPSAQRSPKTPKSPPKHHHDEHHHKEPSFQTLLAETHKNGGPVCSHCGAT
jgi:hypothetical protein